MGTACMYFAALSYAYQNTELGGVQTLFPIFLWKANSIQNIAHLNMNSTLFKMIFFILV